jgi:hypothetical protein
MTAPVTSMAPVPSATEMASAAPVPSAAEVAAAKAAVSSEVASAEMPSTAEVAAAPSHLLNVVMFRGGLCAEVQVSNTRPRIGGEWHRQCRHQGRHEYETAFHCGSFFEWGWPPLLLRVH